VTSGVCGGGRGDEPERGDGRGAQRRGRRPARVGVEVRGRALLRGAPDEGALPGPQAEEAAVHPLPPAVLGVRRHAHAGPPPAPGEVVRRLLARRAPQARRLRSRAGPPAGGERDDGLLPPQAHPRRDGGPAQGRTAREVVSGEVEVDDFYVGAPTRRAVGRGTSRQPMVCAVGTGGGGRCAIGCVPGLSWGDYARFAEGRGDALSHVRADAYGAIAGGLRGWPGLDQRPFSPRRRRRAGRGPPRDLQLQGLRPGHLPRAARRVPPGRGRRVLLALQPPGRPRGHRARQRIANRHMAILSAILPTVPLWITRVAHISTSAGVKRVVGPRPPRAFSWANPQGKCNDWQW
jgi:hypothetical protein